MTTSVPDDILLVIFKQLVRVEGAEAKWPDMLYDERAAQAPFTMAAVCWHWRELAVSTPSLWTYFGFPVSTDMIAQDVQRLELLQRRVGTAPIDVVFGWDHGSQATNCTGDHSFSIFNAILGLHLQWKTVVLHVMGSAGYGWKMDEAFKCPRWPLLKSLSLITDNDQEAVPAAPLLHHMWLDCHRNSIFKPFIAGGYPALTNLSIYCDSVPVLEGLGPAFGNQLVELALLDDFDYVLEPGSPLGVFPVLQCLTLDDVSWLQHINAPALKKLVLTVRHTETMEQAALHRFNHVRELQLCGHIEADDLAILKDVSDITTLTFDCPSILSTAFKRCNGIRYINSVVLRELVDFEPPIWSHLQHLNFGPTFYPGPEDNEHAAQDILNFVSSRNMRVAGLNRPTTARIVNVVNYPGAPEWLERRLCELIAD